MNQWVTLALNNTPDTSGYMMLAYLVILLMIGAYIASLAIRRHRLRTQARSLQAKESDDLPNTRVGKDLR